MILVIDNYDSFTYNLYQQVATLESDVRVVRNDAISVEEAVALKPSGIVLSPGPGMPKDAGICIDLIKRAYREIPILGVCLGHQAIVEALGGEVIHAGEVIQGKTAMVFHTRKGLFSKMPLPCTVGRYHSLTVRRDSLPSELVVDAETADGMVMGVRHVKYPCFGVQFHPESILTEDGGLLIERFIEVCRGDAKATD